MGHTVSATARRLYRLYTVPQIVHEQRSVAVFYLRTLKRKFHIIFTNQKILVC